MMLKNTLLIFMMAALLVACGGKQEGTDTTAEGEGKMMEDKSTAIPATGLTDGSYAIADGSTITWEGKKIAYGHTGTIAVSSGKFDVAGGAITAGSFEVDMTSINTTDLEGQKKEDLDKHLSNADFFESSTYPTASFTITEVKAAEGIEGATHTITGDLTLKGETNPVTFNAMVTEEAGAIMTKAKFTINRAKWKVEFNSSDFPAFANLAADKVISNDIGIEFNLKAEKAADMNEGGE